MNPRLLLVLYGVVVLAPLGLAWAGTRPPRTVADELASGAGLLAFAVILVEFVLSGRFRTVSRRVGMDVTMRIHQLVARTALALALIHPFLYTTPFQRALPWDVTREFSLTSDAFALSTGIAAWVLLPGFVLLSIGRDALPYKYETWRLAHGLGALLVAGLLLHHTLAAGRYSEDPVLAGLWIGLFLLAVMSLLWVYLIEPLVQMRRPWKVASVRQVALKTWQLVLEPEGHAGLDYQAGQFVWLNVGHGTFSLRENPFSISSAPASGPRLEFLIKELGDFTRTVGQLTPGTRAYIDGPHGNLVLPASRAGGVALIAGGVGVAPLLGILRQLHLEKDTRPSALVYGNRVAEQIVFADELDALAREHGTKVVHVLSEPREDWRGEVGMVDGALIRKALDSAEVADWHFVLCGPAAMMEAVEDSLIAMGVPAGQILSERFGYD